MRKVVALSLAGIVLLFSPAFAQGPFLEAGFVYNNPVGSDIRYLRGGPGLDFTFGYNFGPVSFEGSLMGSRHDDSDPGYGHADFGGMSIDLRVFLFPLVEPNQAFFLVGVGSYWLSEYDPFIGADTELRGTGWNVGAGLEHYFNPNMGFNAAVIYRFIRYDEFESAGYLYSVNPDVNGDIVTLKTAIVFYW